MEFISFRADKKLLELAKKLAELESRKASDEYRVVFLAGLKEKMRDIAVEKYKKGDISLGKGADLAGVSVWEFLEILKEERVDLNLETDDIIKAAGEI